MRLTPRRLTDEEYVEKIRRGLVTFDRWRPWFIAIGAICVAALVWLAESGLNAAIRWMALAQQNRGAVIGGFVTGSFVGFAVGGFAYEAVRFWLDALLDKNRSERLMIRYHDAILDVRGTCRGDSDAPDSSGPHFTPATDARAGIGGKH